MTIEPLKMEIEFVSKETVKPAFPTPDHLRKFALSVFDQFNPDFYMPIVLFFPAGAGDMSFSGDRIRTLKVSLSETLVWFYPVAGRVNKEELYVNCDDSGVDFCETKVNGCRLSDILGRPDDKLLWKLLQRGNGPIGLLSVQANVFECGGLAVGACFSHSIMDACAMNNLIKEWAAVARGEFNTSPSPEELNIIASRFPAIPITGPSKLPIKTPDMGACYTRRFVFNGAKVAALRDKATSACGDRPTRVSAVSALIWKSIVSALTLKLGRETRPSIACQSMDIRRRLDPPFPSSSLGNLILTSFVESGDEMELPQLVSQFKQGLKHVTQNFVPKLQDSKEATMIIQELLEKYVTVLIKGDVDLYIFTSWCRYGFYEADFGWGGPAWIGTVISDVKNVVIMMDDRDGDGIEAWVTLPERDMELFEVNPELLEFATPNPPIYATLS